LLADAWVEQDADVADEVKRLGPGRHRQLVSVLDEIASLPRTESM
jgi:hypothetical protein